MLFFTHKKDQHINLEIHILLNCKPLEVDVETKNFENKEGNIYTKETFKVNCVLLSDNLETKLENGETFDIRQGSAFDFKMTKALYDKVIRYDKDDKIVVKLVQGSNKTFWAVEPSNFVPSAKDESKNNGFNNYVDRDNQIKYGMAFNNAVRIVSQIPFNDDPETWIEDVKQRVRLVKNIMPEMFDIACDMPKESKEEDEIPF